MYFDWIQNFKVNFISLTPIIQTSCCSTTRRARASAEITATVGGVYCSWVIMVIRSMCAVFIHSWLLLQKFCIHFKVNKSPKVSLSWYKGRRNKLRSSDCEGGLQQTQIWCHNFRTVLLRPRYQILIMYPPGSIGRRLCLSIKICQSLLIAKKTQHLSVLWVRLSFKNIV